MINYEVSNIQCDQVEENCIYCVNYSRFYRDTKFNIDNQELQLGCFEEVVIERERERGDS